MPAPIRIDASSATPIWSQIEEQVRRLITTGALAAGSVVPSVRDLARDLTINPATVSKAYQRLAAQGLLEVRRGDGTYVTDSPPALPPEELRRELGLFAEEFCLASLQLGASEEEAVTAAHAAWRRLDGDGSPTPTADSRNRR